MKGLLNDIKLVWNIVARMRDIRAFYRGPKWDREDAKPLREFLSSPLGIRLVRQLDYTRSTLIVRSLAPKTEADRAFKAGHAAGFNEFVTMFLSLSATVPPHPDQTTDEYLGSEGFSSETISENQ